MRRLGRRGGGSKHLGLHEEGTAWDEGATSHSEWFRTTYMAQRGAWKKESWAKLRILNFILNPKRNHEKIMSKKAQDKALIILKLFWDLFLRFIICFYCLIGRNFIVQLASVLTVHFLALVFLMCFGIVDSSRVGDSLFLCLPLRALEPGLETRSQNILPTSVYSAPANVPRWCVLFCNVFGWYLTIASIKKFFCWCCSCLK